MTLTFVVTFNFRSLGDSELPEMWVYSLQSHRVKQPRNWRSGLTLYLFPFIRLAICQDCAVHPLWETTSDSCFNPLFCAIGTKISAFSIVEHDKHACSCSIIHVPCLFHGKRRLILLKYSTTFRLRHHVS